MFRKIDFGFGLHCLEAFKDELFFLPIVHSFLHDKVIMTNIWSVHL